MDTVTKLTATAQQCDELIAALQESRANAARDDEVKYARVVLEQMVDSGPWRLVIGVYPPPPES